MGGPRSGVAFRPFDGNESYGVEAVRPAEGDPIASIFEAVEVPVFEGEATAVEGLAEGEGGARDFANKAKGVSEAADPFGFSCSERAVESEDSTRRKEREMAGGVSAGGVGVSADCLWGKFSGGGHSLGEEGRLCHSPGGVGGSGRWG